MTMMAEALRYVEMGLPVFPTTLDKKPYTPRGFHDATCDLATISTWWTRWPEAGISTPMGFGRFAVDIDDLGVLAELERRHEPLPPSWDAISGSGGRHVWLRGDVSNSSGALPAKIHIRGSGGYLVLPPSRHPSGGRYEWRTAPDECPLAPAPDWLMGLLQSPGDLAGAGTHASPPQRVPHGERHLYLKDFAIRLARGGITDATVIEAHLLLEFDRACVPRPLPHAGAIARIATWAAASRIAARERGGDGEFETYWTTSREEA